MCMLNYYVDTDIYSPKLDEYAHIYEEEIFACMRRNFVTFAY